jgi:hypothetical protein
MHIRSRLFRPSRFLRRAAPALYLLASHMAWAGAPAVPAGGSMGTGQPLSLSVIGGILGLWSFAILAVAFTPTSCFAVGFEPEPAEEPKSDVRSPNTMRAEAWPRRLRDASLPGLSFKEQQLTRRRA